MNVHSSDIAALERDGFVVLNGVLPPAEVEEARQDLVKLFELDVNARKEKGGTEAYFQDGPIGQTILTAPSHLALDMFGKSPVFDRLLEKMLTHPRMRRVVEAWCGPHFRIGSVNIRYMTGAIDPPPAHELHRDGPYSINLCIMLSDIEPGENAATALVPGSHWSDLDPRWDTMFEKPFRLRRDPAKSGLDFFLNWNIFNSILKAKSFKKVTGAFGKQGDVYFFPNGEVWHGRLPNMNGRRTMICLMGCSAVTAEICSQTNDRPSRCPCKTTTSSRPRSGRAIRGQRHLEYYSRSALQGTARRFDLWPRVLVQNRTTAGGVAYRSIGEAVVDATRQQAPAQTGARPNLRGAAPTALM